MDYRTNTQELVAASHQVHHGSPTAISPATTVQSGHGSIIGDDSIGRKRKRSTLVGDEYEAGGHHEDDENGVHASPASGGRPRHQPGVKRACNDCRQQKLRCNVVADTEGVTQPCSRCVKHKLTCSIDSDFKRLGKRAQHEEMVKELEACKAKLAKYEALGLIPEQQPGKIVDGQYVTPHAPVATMTGNAFLGPNEAAASRSLLDLSQGFRELAPVHMPNILPGTTVRNLGSVTLTEDQLRELFDIYFNHFHRFLPVLSQDLMLKTGRLEVFYNLHPLLHWTIVATAARRYDARPGLLVEMQGPLLEMLWTTLSHVPQTYHVCKALALLCAWPMPNSSTSHEPTMMLVGVMFQLAMQYGLHRPSHANDFSRFRIELREEDIVDRLNTWATVNIVAQNVATGNGQPPLSRWAWYTYGLHLNRMKSELDARCRIEKFVDTVTRTIFTMQRDHIVEVDEAHRGLSIDMYARELGELEITLLSAGATPVELLFLKAASLHLRLSAFFDKPTQPNYVTDLRHVYLAATSYLKAVTELEDDSLLYVPRYIEQMILAGATTMLKLLNSFFANHVDVPVGRTLFTRSSEQRLFNDGESAIREPDDTLQLKVRCRSSLSVLFDAIWRWRQQVGQSGRESLAQAVEHPTSVPTDTHGANTPNPGAVDAVPGLGVLDPSLVGDVDPLAWDGAYSSNAVFDPLSWALDGNLQFPTFGGSDGLGF
ncbi:hypothetical protein AMS68_005097 [Peltaster fructicola]|uniref:Zn(2)-C6 fungal-type domain-containing protein n=1 Tax=Peltaster fructicola TaxID=286661 RepID=A0A6H0XYT4_9PEZI|nr:hypothetical protein AMS68_005097 [Peltaster fructicola]